MTDEEKAAKYREEAKALVEGRPVSSAEAKDMEAEARRVKEEEQQRKASERPPVLGGKRMRSGGMVSSASKRADGCAIRGKTRGKMV